MKDYKQLAVRYLKHNKKRTMLTIFGVALSTMILFAFLNAMISLYYTSRDKVREEVKYEAVILCGDKSVQEQIAEEAFIVKTEETMVQLSLDDGGGQAEGLFVSFKHPFLTKKNLKDLNEKYGVTHQVTSLGYYYFADEGIGVFGIIVLAILLVAYIFAIFSVSVVRNSIQLISLEQIRDYGVLRCVGSTKNQLKSVVFWMGFLLELNGIVLGSIFGFFLYLPLAIKTKLDIGCHVIIIPIILVIFMFDLYFVMQENCRFVNRLTPVAAVRGEFKINKNKIKARRKSLAGVVFGVEGDYAMKNLKRNPARMWKTIGIMSMGIMMVTMSLSIYLTVYDYVMGDAKQFGRYQICDYDEWEPGAGALATSEFSRLEYYNVNILQNNECVTEYKPLYEAVFYFGNPLEMYEHIDPEFGAQPGYGSGILTRGERYKDGDTDRKKYLVTCRLVGYDTTDYERLEETLIEGTLDLSENGIVLINGTSLLSNDMGTLNETWKEYTITNYQVGDTIKMIDYKAMSRMVEQRLIQKNLKSSIKDLNSYPYITEVIMECYDELVEAGKMKEYVIEAIVSKDVNRATMFSQEPVFVFPLNRYFGETGLNSSNQSGMMYHIDGVRLPLEIGRIFYSSETYEDLSYLMVMSGLSDSMNIIIGGTIFVLFLFVINMLNVVNTTSSDLYLRRREFAQLRVLGMSKKRLTITVLLEAVFVAVVAGVIGVVGAYVAMDIVMQFINIGYYIPLRFSWGTCIGMVALCTLLICMTVYIPIKNMKMNMAEELLASGE